MPGSLKRPARIGLVLVLSLASPLFTGAAARAAAPDTGTAGQQWVNHDNGNWPGWDNRANPGSAANPAGCDPIDPAQCMLPYPNDWFTSYDRSSLTTRRLNLNILAMPRNAAGKPIDPSAWNDGSDGFSAGAQILTVVPGMTRNSDLAPSGLPSDTDMALNSSPAAGVILLDADTGKRWPVWAEVDQYTQEDGVLPAGATNYTSQQNPYIARQITGTFTVPCYIAPSCSPPVKCETITAPAPLSTPFDDCPSPGEFALDPANLYAVPGQTYTAGFICDVGRQAFGNGQLLRPVEYGHGLFGSDSEVSASPQEEMAGRFGMMYCATDWFGFANADVPNAVLALSDLSDFPVLTDRTQQGELNFLYLQRLMIHPGGFSSDPAFQYPDGRSFIDTSAVYYDGNSQGGIYGGTVCAVSIDVKHCALGVPAMGYPVLLPRSSDYVATAPVSASQLLSISPSNPTGGLELSNFFDLFYPDQSQRQLILDLIQTLWDRADPDGYATHMTSAAAGGLLPGTPDHRVLMQVAWSDHQVTDVAAEDEARSIGAAAISPAVGASRLCGSNDPGGPYCYQASSPLWGIPAITGFPYGGSAIVFFDAGPAGAGQYGTQPPPPADVPNSTGGDPHEAPRRACAAQQQKSGFLADGGAVTEPPQPDGPAPPPYFSGGWQQTCTLP